MFSTITVVWGFISYPIIILFVKFEANNCPSRPQFVFVYYLVSFLTLQACNAHGIYCVPLYDTLGK